MMKRMQTVKNEKGLTLIELLVVIVILGIIAAIAVVAIGGIVENSKKDAHIANAQQIANAAKLYFSTINYNETEVTLEDLQKENYLDDIRDPSKDKGKSYNPKEVTVRYEEEEGKYIVKLENYIKSESENKDVYSLTREDIDVKPGSSNSQD